MKPKRVMAARAGILLVAAAVIAETPVANAPAGLTHALARRVKHYLSPGVFGLVLLAVVIAVLVAPGVIDTARNKRNN